MYMLFGKKEDKNKLPDLPSPKGNYGMNDNSLPSFPDSPTQRGFSQSAIKDAVASPNMHTGPRTVEMKEWSPAGPAFDDEDDMPLPDTPPARMEFPHRQEMEEMDEEEMPITKRAPPKPQMMKPKMEMKNDVFVRIDKFNHARRALDKAQESLEQIDELVKKIRETKLKEDQELSSWENDILHVKARIKEVTETVFEKLE